MSTPKSRDDEREAGDDLALRRMLDHAPDHAAMPDPRLRAAIRAKALDAIRPPPVQAPLVSWRARWKAWLGLEGQGASRTPWSAAFATLALAVLIMVLWPHEPVPGPQLDSVAEAPAPQVAPTPPSGSEARAPRAAALEKAAPSRDMADAATSAAAPSLRAAPPPPPPPASAAPSFAALTSWTRLTVTQADGRSRSLSREDAGTLAALVDSVARSGVTANPAPADADWRLGFVQDGEVRATLELAGDAVRWREGAASVRSGRPPPQALAALRSALARRFTGE